MPDAPAQPVDQPKTLEGIAVDLARQALVVDPATGRRGIQTTEFWSHAALVALGGVILVYGLSKHDNGLVYFGGALAGTTSFSYSTGRSLVKAALAMAVK